MPQDPRHYTPTTPEANLAREQGAGMGQRDLSAQRDASRDDIATAPNRPDSFDTDLEAGARGEDRTFTDSDEDDEEAESLTAADLQPDPRLVGVPANVDPESLEDGHGPQMDWGEPEPDAIHGSTHANRPIKTEAERGQGPKTRSRNKQIVSGKPYG